MAYDAFHPPESQSVPPGANAGRRWTPPALRQFLLSVGAESEHDSSVLSRNDPRTV